jgi:selenoprotein W-related protein
VLEEKYPEAEVTLIDSRGGVFEVVVDGRLIFSKKKLGRHATHEEILDALE